MVTRSASFNCSGVAPAPKLAKVKVSFASWSPLATSLVVEEPEPEQAATSAAMTTGRMIERNLIMMFSYRTQALEQFQRTTPLK